MRFRGCCARGRCIVHEDVFQSYYARIQGQCCQACLANSYNGARHSVCGGVGTLSPTILDSFGTELDAQNAPDLIIKSTSPLGFTGEQLARIESLDFADEAESLTVADMDDGGVNTRIYVYSSFDTALNRLDIDGRLPEGPGEVLVERQNNYTQKYSVGDTVNVMGAEYTICGIVSNPLIFDRLGEPGMADMQPLEKIVYFTAEWLPFSMPVTDVYVGIGALRMFGRFSAAYGERAAEYAALWRQPSGFRRGLPFCLPS